MRYTSILCHSLGDLLVPVRRQKLLITVLRSRPLLHRPAVLSSEEKIDDLAATVSNLSGHRLTGLALASVALLLWGGLPVVLKLLLQWLDPFTVTWYRLLVAGAMLVPLVHFRHGLASPFRIRGAALALALVCVLVLGGNYLTYQMGLSRISPASAQIVMQLTPVIVLMGGLILFNEFFSRLQWIGLAALILGLGLFFNQRFAELVSAAGNYGRGVWLVVASAVLWGIFMLAQKRLLRHLPSTSILALVYWSGMILFLPLARPKDILELAPLPLSLLAFSAVFTLVSYLSFAEALKRLEASRIGALVSLTPLITMAVMGLLGLFDPDLVPMEPLNKPAVAGALIVVAGSTCCNLGRIPRGLSGDAGKKRRFAAKVSHRVEQK